MHQLRVKERDPAAGQRPRSSPAWAWIAQVVSGALLLVLLTVHMIANHFLVGGGPRTYAQVLDYVANPLILALETVFLVVVTWHAMLGLHAVLLDLGLKGRAARAAARVLAGLGLVTLAYGLWLLATLASRA
jgi:succinate dehydrogenase hydrophobic anchor subunit